MEADPGFFVHGAFIDAFVGRGAGVWAYGGGAEDGGGADPDKVLEFGQAGGDGEVFLDMWDGEGGDFSRSG